MTDNIHLNLALNDTTRAMLKQVPDLTADQVRALDAAWRSAGDIYDTHKAALDAGFAAPNPTGFSAWCLACDAADMAAPGWPLSVRYDYGTALYAIHDALIAEIARGLISDADYDLLTAPWRRVVGTVEA